MPNTWATPLDERGRIIPTAGRSAAPLSDLRIPRPSASTTILMAAVFCATIIALFIGEGATAAFTVHNAARIEAGL